MTQVPNEEQRGGDRPDWDSAVAGEPLPEQPAALPPPGDLYDASESQALHEAEAVSE